MKIKILLVVPMLETGGGQKLAIDIATYIDKSKFDVCLLSLHPRNGMLFEKMVDEREINIIYLSKTKGFGSRIVKDIYDISKVINQYKPDVIHTHLYVVPYILIPTILAGVKKRIHTIHTLAFRETSGFRRIIMGAAYEFFGFLPIVISDYNKACFMEEYKFQKDKVVCIYNGVNTNEFCKFNDFSRKKDNKFRFISVGRFESVKNHRMMIDAFSIVNKTYKNVELVLVGDGELRPDIEQLIVEKDLADYVILMGASDRVVEELNKADIYLSSSDVEGLPLTVLEAMACQLPIVTTEAGGVVDIVKNGENGLITPVRDARALSHSMIELIENEELRKVMGANSRKKSVELDIHNCVEKYQSLYGEEDDSVENIISNK